MDFKNKVTGIIYHVTNEVLIPSYEGNENFEKVERKEKAQSKTKKNTEE